LSEEKLADYNPSEDPDFVPDGVPSGSEDGSNDEEETERVFKPDVLQVQPEVDEVVDDDVCIDEREGNEPEEAGKECSEQVEESEAERLGEVVDESLE